MTRATAIVVISLALAGPALAAPADPAQLEKAGKFVECGQAYIERFSAKPDGDPSVLWKGASCFERGHSIGTAIQVLHMLGKLGNAPQQADALFHGAELYGRIAFYDQAAQDFEAFTGRFGADPRAPVAAAKALVMTRMVGNVDRHVKLVQKFVKLYGRQRPELAAQVSYSLIAVYEDRHQVDDTRRTLESFVARFPKGPVELRILALVKLAQLEWEEACPDQGADGLCVRVTRTRAGGNQAQRCTQTALTRTPLARNATATGRARKRLLEAIQLWKAAATVPPERKLEVATAITQAMVLVADWLHEQFLSAPVPSFPAKTKPAKTLVVLATWLAKRRSIISDAKSSYLAAAAVEPMNGWTLAARAHLGILDQELAELLEGSPIPPGGSEVENQLFCATQELPVKQLVTSAIDAFSACTALGAKLALRNPWFDRCEAGLNQLAPGRFHALRELLPPVDLGPMIGIALPE